MTTMNISLPDQMKKWVETRIDSGQYHNASEYLRDLIRRDQMERARTEAFQAAIEKGRQSGIDERPFERIVADAKARAGDIK